MRLPSPATRPATTPFRGPGCGERSLDALLADLDATAQRIATALATMSEADLARLVKTDRGVKSVAHHVAGLHWHETYHTGQLELLRRDGALTAETVIELRIEN